MTRFPLLFRRQRLVAGRGFVAHVDIRGRLVAHRTDAGFWLSGVEPGDVSASGATLHEAFAAFQESLAGVLADIAMDPASFDEFEVEVSAFFASRDGEEERIWNEAVECVRTNPDDTRFLNLLRLSADDPRGVKVTLLQPSAVSPSDNATPYPPALAA